MKEGLLWFDNNPKRKLADKVNRAAIRYEEKFSRRPTICYLNTADLDDKTDEVEGIRLRSVPNVLRNHLWIGVENDMAEAA